MAVGHRSSPRCVTLGVVCTALAFLVFFALIREIGPVRATVITYVNPAVAVTLGVLLLHERLTAGIAAGFVLILSGSVLAARAGADARPGPESDLGGLGHSGRRARLDPSDRDLAILGVNFDECRPR